MGILAMRLFFQQTKSLLVLTADQNETSIGILDIDVGVGISKKSA